MTKRERFMNFLSNKPVDRVPVAFFHHFTTSDEWGKGLVDEDIFRRNIEGHRTALERFDPDVIKIMNDSLMIMPLDTSFVKTAADLRNIQPPTPDSPYGRKTRELTERSMAIYAGNEAFIYATGFSPLMVLKTSLDPGDQPDPRLPRFLQEDPESVMAALDILAKAIMDLNEMLIKECGVDGIYFSVNNQNHYIPDDLFTKYIAPVEIRVMEHANGLSPINLLHICGYHGRGNNLELFKNHPAAAYNIAVYAEGVSLSEGRKLFGGKPVFGGFAQDTVIYTGTREEVKKATWDILDECGQVGVMVGADCTVPMDIDDDRFNWVRKAAEEYAASH